MSGYASAAGEYWAKSWRGVLPLPPSKKFPPPVGTTGHDGYYPSWPDIQAWSEQTPDANLGLRLPNTVVGVDVDAYNGKTGGQTLAEAERRWGELPPTWRSTSRNDGVSGIRLYRVQAGLEFDTKIGFPELGLGHIEVCQFFHRYVVAWPSIHDETGRTYRWLDHAGMESDIPREGHLPYLPQQWVQALARESAGPLSSADVKAALAGLTQGPLSPSVQKVLARALMDLTGNPESRHDTTLHHVFDLLRESEKGESGVQTALEQLRAAFVRVVGKDRGEQAAAAEFDRMVAGQRGHDLIATYPSNQGLLGAPPKSRVSAYLPEEHAQTLEAVRPQGPEGWQEDIGQAFDASPPMQSFVDVDYDPIWDLMGTEPPKPSGVDEGNRTSWGLLDIDQLLSDDTEPELPTVLRMDDGTPLFYPGRVNALVGEPESAKSWLAQLASTQEIRAACKAIYIDFEDIGRNIVARLRLLGADDSEIRGSFGVSNPDSPLGADEQEELFAAVDELMPTVIVVDGVNAAMVLLGLDLEKNTDCTQFHQFLLKPLTRQGAAVITVDHVPKNKMGRGGFAIGAQAKKAMVDGAMLGVTCKVPFGEGRLGELEIVVLKDKIGKVRKLAEKRGNDDYLATVEIDARQEGRVVISICKKGTGNGSDGNGISKSDANLLFKMARVSEFLDRAGREDGLSFTAIFKELKGGRDELARALTALEERGSIEVVDGPRASRLHRFVTRFQPTDLDLLGSPESTTDTSGSD